MQGRTHIGVGTAAALAVVRPTGMAGCVACVLGAALGSLICDIDVRPSDRQRTAFRLSMAILVIALMLLAYDVGSGGVVLSAAVAHLGPELVLGAAGFVATSVFGALTPHRTFAHSLVALGLWTTSLELLWPALALPFAVGVASHRVLDLTNKQGVQLFWPLKVEVSLGLWKSDGYVDNLLAIVGLVAAVVLFVVGVAT